MLFSWQGQKESKLLCNPSCGARTHARLERVELLTAVSTDWEIRFHVDDALLRYPNTRSLGARRVVRPRRFVTLPSSAPGGGRDLTRQKWGVFWLCRKETRFGTDLAHIMKEKIIEITDVLLTA